MAEQDRLAALLERATRERRADAEEAALAEVDRREIAHVHRGDGEQADASADTPEVGGGQWLPPDPGRHRRARTGPPVLAVPPSLRSLNIGVRPIAVIALLVVALVAAGIFALRWWRAEQGSVPVPVAPQAAVLTPAAGGADAAASTSDQEATVPDEQPPGGAAATASAGPTTTRPAELLVHVAGQVHSAGVVRLAPGARVQDAVEAAGGLGDDADTSRLNLARPVTDGERIWVPRPGEEVPEVTDVPAPPAGTGAEATPSGGSGGGQEQININTADQAVLEQLPGVGPVTAGAIVAWREEHGRFSSPDELLEVSGIGEATLDKLRPHVTL